MTATIQPKTVIFDINGVLIRLNTQRALHRYLAKKAEADSRISLDWAGDVASLMNGLLYKFCPLCNFSICKVVPANSPCHLRGALQRGEISYAQAKALKTQMLTHYVKLPAAAQITLDYVVEFSTRPNELLAEAELIEEGVALLKHFHARCGAENIFILSNSPSEMLSAGRAKFAELFDLIPEQNIVISGHTGICKPDSRAFEQLAIKGNVAPSESLFIDDSGGNVKVAREVGFYAVTFAQDASADLQQWYTTVGFEGA